MTSQILAFFKLLREIKAPNSNVTHCVPWQQQPRRGGSKHRDSTNGSDRKSAVSTVSQHGFDSVMSAEYLGGSGHSSGGRSRNGVTALNGVTNGAAVTLAGQNGAAGNGAAGGQNGYAGHWRLARVFNENDEALINRKLPKELLLRIFSHLDVISLCRCAQVSKAWNVLALDGSNWQKVDLFDFQVDIEGIVVENIARR